MTELPDKLYFRIGEVAALAEVEPYVIRFWQKEFKQLNPRKSSHGQRRFTRQEVELVLTIARLRYQEKYSLEGIKKVLHRRTAKDTYDRNLRDNHDSLKQLLLQIRREIDDILHMLDRTPD